jgi:hypothetical protein
LRSRENYERLNGGQIQGALAVRDTLRDTPQDLAKMSFLQFVTNLSERHRSSLNTRFRPAPAAEPPALASV